MRKLNDNSVYFQFFLHSSNLSDFTCTEIYFFWSMFSSFALWVCIAVRNDEIFFNKNLLHIFTSLWRFTLKHFNVQKKIIQILYLQCSNKNDYLIQIKKLEDWKDKKLKRKKKLENEDRIFEYFLLKFKYHVQL